MHITLELDSCKFFDGEKFFVAKTNHSEKPDEEYHSVYFNTKDEAIKFLEECQLKNDRCIHYNWQWRSKKKWLYTGLKREDAYTVICEACKKQAITLKDPFTIPNFKWENEKERHEYHCCRECASEYRWKRMIRTTGISISL